MSASSPGTLTQERLASLARVAEGGPRPLFATLSGAHLYGFPSPDSDFDLRGAYVAPLRRVLGLEGVRETFVREVPEFELPDGAGTIELDWVAHEVGKYCSLIRRPDGVVLEQVFSPLVVIDTPWLEELRTIAAGCVTRGIHHHYRGFFRSRRKALEKTPTVKCLLYAYRAGLTGVEVLKSGRIEANLFTLCERHPQIVPSGLTDLAERKRQGAEKANLAEGEIEAHAASLDALEAALEAAFEASSLPERPTTGAALSDFVVRARLALGVL